MAALRWAAFIVCAVCLGVAATGIREWMLAGLMLLSFLVVCWTFRTPRPRRPVSRWFADIPSDHPDALGSLDLLERYGSTNTVGGVAPPHMTPPAAPHD